VLQQPFGYLLAGISKVRRATLYSILSMIAALIAIFVLVPRIGVNALPLGLIIGFVPFILCGNVVETFVILGQALRRPGASLAPHGVVESSLAAAGAPSAAAASEPAGASNQT
jgi:hypothetical protein